MNARHLAGIVVLTVAAGMPLAGQGKPAEPPSKTQLITAAREIMIAVRYATFVTNGPGGQPQARIVDAFGPDSALTVFVATNTASRKVEQIKKDAKVTLLYFSPVTFEYVTLIGKATIDNDPKHKAAHWKSDWAKMYKDEYRGSDYLLIEFKPSRIEVVSQRRGIGNDPATWLPASATLP